MKSLNAGRIHKDDVKSTLDYFNLPGLMDNVLGSVGKQETSGDIDIALDSIQYDIDTFLEFIPEVKDYRVNAGLQCLSVVIDITGTHDDIDDYTGTVQVDFFFGDVEWLKFSYYSPGDESEYKGKYRTELLASLISEKSYYRDFLKGELLSRIGPVFNRSTGVYVQYSTRPERKDKKGYVKNFKTVTLEHPAFHRSHNHDLTKQYDMFINTPEALAEFLFGDANAINTFRSYEALMVEYNKRPHYEQLTINEIFKKRVGIDLKDVPKITDGSKIIS